MQWFLTNLTIVALAIHAFFGCPCHEPQSCVPLDDPAAAVAHSTHCCEHHQDAPPAEQAPAEPCKCKLTCHGVCISLPPPRPSLETAEDGFSVGLAAVDQAASSLLAGTATCLERAHVPDAGVPPLRLHLMHQVLLI